jgi:fatty-acyl-CoA synthase
VPHPFYGESYRLCVRLKPEAPADAEASVSDYVFSSLAKHKWPEAVKAVTDFPRTASGKIRKFLLKEST